MHLTLCFFVQTLCILFQKHLFQTTVHWEFLRKCGKLQPEPYTLSKHSGLIIKFPFLCCSYVLILGENNSGNNLSCLVYVFISSFPPPCLFICPVCFSSKNAFYMQMMIINLCKSIWLGMKGAELERLRKEE